MISFNTILSWITCFGQKKRAIPPTTVCLSSVVSFHGKLYMVKMHVNSEANWTKFLIENKKKVTFRGHHLKLLQILEIL